MALRFVLEVIDTQHEHHVGVAGRGRDHDGACAGVEMRLRLLALRETPRRLDDYVDVQLPPGEILGFRDRERP